MPTFDHEGRHDEHGEDARAIHSLTHILADWLAESKMQFHWMVAHHYFATKQDLENLNQDLTMKLSEVKVAVAAAAAEIKKNNREAFTELGARIADLNQQIADLVAGASDPEVSDTQFLQDLNDAKADAQALADIVPGSVSNGSGQV